MFSSSAQPRSRRDEQMSVYDLEYDIKSWKELLADLSKAKELIGRMKEKQLAT